MIVFDSMVAAHTAREVSNGPSCSTRQHRRNGAAPDRAPRGAAEPGLLRGRVRCGAGNRVGVMMRKNRSFPFFHELVASFVNRSNLLKSWEKIDTLGGQYSRTA